MASWVEGRREDQRKETVKIPRMKSCRVGKASGGGGVLEAEVNSISFRRTMILTVHNRCLFFQDTKQSSCVEQITISGPLFESLKYVL